jgi:hypothetical protein
VNPNKITAHFKTLDLGAVPHARAGNHKKIVSMILPDLGQLKEGAALGVLLADLGNTKENVRSALNRATQNAKRNSPQQRMRTSCTFGTQASPLKRRNCPLDCHSERSEEFLSS